MARLRYIRQRQPRIPVNAPLDQHVLVLNRLWQPVNTCTARRAVALLFLGHAQVVHGDAEANFWTHDVGSWLAHSEEVARRSRSGDGSAMVIRSVSWAFVLPRIIVLGTYDRLPKKEIKFTRDNVFQRDQYTCQYCCIRFEPKELNIDHVIPREKGGTTTWENVVCSCIRCNTKKANKLPEQAKMHPRAVPRAPRWRPMFGMGRNTEPHFDESWRFFLEPSSARVELSA